MSEEIILLSDKIERLDKFVADGADISRAKAQSLIANGNITVNEKSPAKSYKTKVGDTVKVIIPEAVDIDVLPENIALDIVYEDSDLLVVNKAKGMVVHPAPGNYQGTMVNALLYHAKDSLSGINGKIRPGIVHRIDKDTSGLLIVAKNDFAHNDLAKQIKDHSFTREYRAIVYGKFQDEQGTVDAPIGRNPRERKQMAVVLNDSTAKNAVTHYGVVERFSGFSYIKLRLETGRTHQIRVHMAYLGKPVAGDPIYGPRSVITELKGQCLHAGLIGFVHPRTGEYMEFEAPLPDYFEKYLAKLKKRL